MTEWDHWEETINILGCFFFNEIISLEHVSSNFTKTSQKNLLLGLSLFYQAIFIYNI